MKKTILAIATLTLTSCAHTGDGESSGVSPYAGRRLAVGLEMNFGNHAVGVGITHKYEKPPAVVVEEGHAPYSDK